MTAEWDLNAEHAGRALTAWVLAMNGWSLLLLAAAWGADRLLRGRVSAAWRLMLYFAVFARLTLPLTMTWAAPLWHAPAPDLRWSVRWAQPITTTTLAGPAHPEAVASLWPLLVLAAYAAGVAWLAGRWWSDHRSLRAVLDTAERRGDLLVTDTAGPMVVGALRPRIVVPPWLCGRPLELVLAHEEAHIRRRDPLLAAALRAACTIAWPVAPAWVAASRVRALMEQACDERALSPYHDPNHDQDKEIRMQYARTMLDVAERATMVRGVLGFGASLRDRIAALRPSRRWPLPLQVAAALLIPAAMVACSTAAPSETTKVAAAQEAAAKRDAQRAESAKEAAKLEARRADTRLISVRLLSGDAKAPGVTFAGSPAGTLDLVVASRITLAGLVAPGSGGTVLSAPQISALVGQEASVSVGDTLKGSFTIRITILPSEPGTTRMNLAYEEGPAQSPAYSLQTVEVAFKADQAAAVRLPGPDGKPPRILMVTVDLAPAATPGSAVTPSPVAPPSR